jgi:hypothetical protein
MEVMVCPGPKPGRADRCPAVDGEPCPMAAGADIIICELPPGDQVADDIRAAHARVHPELPLIGPVTADDELVRLLRRIPVSCAPDL